MLIGLFWYHIYSDHTVIPSSLTMARIVEIVPLYTGPFTSRWDTGSDSEWICNWSLILTTSSGAMQNLSGVVY